MWYEDMYTAAGTDQTATDDTSVGGGGYYTVIEGPKIELPFQVDVASVQIKGLTYLATGTPTAGQFTVAYDDTAKKSTITLVTGDAAVGDDVLVTYKRRVAQASVTSIATNGGSARGSLTLTYPVMSSGDDCTQADVIGYWHEYIPRVMVTQRPSTDTSRGTAATPQITFSAIDAHRGDNQWYRLIYEPLDENGNISTDYGTGTFIWD